MTSKTDGSMERLRTALDFPTNAGLFGGPRADVSCADLTWALERVFELDKSATYWKADNVSRARLMVKMHDRLIEIAEEISDEGGRAYFGSTNHADDFRDFVSELDNLKWERIAFDAQERDLIGELRAAREKVAALEVGLRDMIELCNHANPSAFSNGNTDSTGTIDEGDVRAAGIIGKARALVPETAGVAVAA